MLNTIKYQSFLLLILPFLMITGPFLPDLALTIICLLFIAQKIIDKDIDLRKLDIFGKIFFTWCAYLIIRSLLSKDPYLSLENSLFFFRFGIFAYAVKFIIINNTNFIKKFFFVLSASIIFVIIDGYTQYFIGKNFFGYNYDGLRMSLFDDEKFIGHYLARLIPIIFALSITFYAKSNKHILFSMTIFVLADVLIFLSGERTSFFILTIFTFLMLCLLSKWKLIRFLTIIISFIIILIITTTNNSVKHRMVIQTTTQTNSSVTFSPEHDLLYESAYNIFLENKLFGVGPKIFRLICDDENFAKDSFGYRKIMKDWDETNSCNSHPHNIYIQLLAETGIFGTIPIIAFFMFLAILLFLQLFNILVKKNYIMSDYVVCLAVSIFVQLWPIMPHLSFFNNRVNVFIFLTLGLLMAHKYINKVQKVD